MSKTFIQKKFPEGKISHTQWGIGWRMNCPFCAQRGHSEDIRASFSIYLMTGICRCFRCSYSASLKRFLWEYDQTKFVFEEEPLNPVKLRDRLIKVKTIKLPVNLEIPDFVVFKDSRLPFYDRKLLGYLYHRGWTDRDINERQVGYIHSSKYHNRVVFPFYWPTGELTYWQGRAIYDSDKPKYLNPPVDKSWAVYNISQALNFSEVVLVEGIFDCVLENSMAILGKTLSLNLLEVILSLWDSIVIYLDRDALREAHILARLIHSYQKNVRLASCSGKDPGSISQMDVLRDIEMAKSVSSIGNLRMRIRSEKRLDKCV